MRMRQRGAITGPRMGRAALRSITWTLAALCGIGGACGRGSEVEKPMSEEHIFLTRSIGSAGMLGTRIGPGEALVRTDLSLRPSRRIGLFRMPIERGIWE